MRKFKFFKFFFLICMLSFIIHIFLNKMDIKALKTTNSKFVNTIDINSYCEIEGEWLSLNYLTYFKKTAAYFIVDLNTIFLNFLQHYKINSANFNFNLTIEIINDTNSMLTIEKSFSKHRLQKIERWKTNYQSRTIQIHLNLFEALNKDSSTIQDLINSNRLRMKLTVVDKASGHGLRLPLDLRLKYSPHHYSLSKNLTSKIAVCSKVLFINNEEQLNNFKMWVQLSELIGYEKLIVYNRPGYKFDSKREKFFNRYKHLLEVRHQVCMPNIHDPADNEKYLNISISENPTGRYLTTMDTISFVYVMECYLDHFDQFKYYPIFTYIFLKV